MAKRRRRLSPQHRAKIARGLRRFYREQERRAKIRSAAAKRGWLTRKAQAALRDLAPKKQAARAKAAPAPVPLLEREEWEVTVKYQVKGKTVDITVRLVARVPRRWTNAEVRAAAWYAHKHGPDALLEWDVHGIDWRNTHRGEQVSEYHYPTERVSLAEAFENAGGLFNKVGLGGLRVAKVEQ